MPRKAAHVYPGDLGKPITFVPPGILGSLSGDSVDPIVKQKLSDRLILLIQHYKIDVNQPDERIWFALAMKLAFEHVPGLQLRPPVRRGRKKKWMPYEARALVEAIDRNKTKKGLKIAIRAAMKNPDWHWGDNIGSIETRYHEAKREIKRTAQFDEWFRSQHGATLMGGLFGLGQASLTATTEKKST